MSLSAPERTIYDVQRDLDIDELLKDAVPPPACEFFIRKAGRECGAPATWIMIVSCGHTAYFDDAHKAAIERALPPMLGCTKEGAPSHAPHLPVTVRFERINL